MISYIARKTWAIFSATALFLMPVARPVTFSQAQLPPPSNLSILPLWATTVYNGSRQPQVGVYRVYYGTRERLATLAVHFGIWEVRREAGYAVIGLDSPSAASLIAQGYRLELDTRWNPPQILGPSGYPCYRDVDQLYADLQQIAADYPDLTELIDYGDSWRKVNNVPPEHGYDLWVLKITNSQIEAPKPRFILMANIHARELTTPETAMYFIEYLVDHYGTDPDVTWIVDYHEVYVVVTANPDGRQLAEDGCLQRKNRNNSTSSSCTLCASIVNEHYGVDLNRNFPYHWEKTTTWACDEMYQGPSAQSEPETYYLIDYIKSIIPDQRADGDDALAPDDATGLLISLHSYGNFVLSPWSWTRDDSTPNDSQLQTLGRKFAYFNHYTPGQFSKLLYPATGEASDWAYGELGIPAYTFEMGESFFQPCSDLQQIMDENLGALLYAAKVPRTPYLTPSGPDGLDLTVAPAAASISETVLLTATINDTHYNNSNGIEPTQNISAAEYYTDVPPWITTTAPISHPMTAADGSFDEKIEVATATIDTTSMSQGRHTVFVRGQDADGHWGPFSAVFLWVGDPVSIVVTPSSATITVGATQTFTATGYDQYGYPMPITPTWTTNGGAMSPTLGITTIFTAQTTPASGRLITATQGATFGTVDLDIVHSHTETVELTPAAAVVAIGESQSYNVTARDAYSNPWDITALSAYTITSSAGGMWRDNVYTAEIVGTWTVTATYLDLTDTAVLTTIPHAPTPASTTLSPAQRSIEAGEQVTYTLVATDTYGNSWDATASAHYTITPGAGGVWTNSVYTTEIAGAWTVTAAYLGLTDTAVLAVAHAPTAADLTLSPTQHTVTAGQQTTYTLIARDLYGNPWDVTAGGHYTITPGAGGTWTNNVYLAEFAGVRGVTATYLGLTDAATLTVTHAPTATGITLSPAQHTVTAGEPVAYTLIATDTYGNPWDITADGQYSITPGAGGVWTNNVYTAEIAGVWTVTAAYLGLTNTAVLTAIHAPIAADLTLNPAQHTVAAGEPVAYTLIAADTYGNSWDATAGGHYTVTSHAGGVWTNNVYTAEIAGDWTVTASYLGLTKTALLVVTHAPIAASAALEPSRLTVGAGGQVIYTLIAADAHGNSWNATASASFTTSLAAGGSWTDNVYTSQNIGVWTITGTVPNATATAVLTVTRLPAASFTRAPVGAACVEATVQFTDTSAGNPTAWRWALGDGIITNLQHPTHTYTTTGAFIITLTITNVYGSDVAADTIQVIREPSVDITRSPTGPVCLMTNIAFSAANSGGPATYVWSFGDGVTAAGQYAGHSYSTPGTYIVWLTAANSCHTDVASTTITVASSPTAAFTHNAAGDVLVNTTVQFTDTSTGAPTAWLWSFGDGMTSTWQHPSHIYTAAGVYTVILTVSGGCGLDDVSQTLNVVQRPLASFTHVPTGAFCVGATVQFTDTSAGNPIAWRWAFGDGSATDIQHPAHTYTKAGTFTITLTITNAHSSDAATSTVQVLSGPSIAISSIPVGSVCIGTHIALSATNSGGPANYLWDFGDGVTAAGQYNDHTYTAAGTYTVWLTATNDCATAVVSTSITVIPDPVASFIRNPLRDVLPNTMVQFTDTSSGEPTAWLWRFGDGFTSTLQHPDHIYSSPGTFTVTLTITQACGSDTVADIVTVQPSGVAPTIVTLISNSPVTIGYTLHCTATVMGTLPIAYAWDFGDDTGPMTGSDLMTSSHLYTNSGVYTAHLTVANCCGSDSAALIVAVNTAPERGSIYLPLVIRHHASQVSAWDTDEH